MRTAPPPGRPPRRRPDSANVDLEWLRRTDQRRVVHLTEPGRHGLHDTFGGPGNWDDLSFGFSRSDHY
ncbi:hypothetical protein FXW78_08845 [Rhodococcus opacus]|nr:hypothetical protein [Rhodococcus opacus]RZL77271.1 MAG: hypothetical protein EOP32_25565 [Rhodococcus sp. (in: high G+C Gram-positive bacteria)]